MMPSLQRLKYYKDMKNKGEKIAKQIFQNHAKKMARLKKRHREFRRKKNRILNGKNESQRASERLNRQFAGYKKIIAPTNFSLTENTEESLLFISKLENCLESSKKVFVNLSKVEQMAQGAIVVLLSIMIKFKSKHLDFNGNFPQNEDAKKRLVDSGFFYELYKKNINLETKYEICRNKVLTHANKIVDTELSDKIISEISTLIWGVEKRCTGLQRVFIELMQNTNNHASYNIKGEHHWWTTVQFDKENHKAYFSFIDYGVGIINSLRYDQGGKFFNILPYIKSLFCPQNDSDMLMLLLNGDIHETSNKYQKTSTKKYYRGKGLPCLFNACKDNRISKVVVITNHAKVEYENYRKTNLNTPFTGTFIHWELNYNNKNFNK